MGEHYAECMNGRWSVYSFPICISKSAAVIYLNLYKSLLLILQKIKNRKRMCSNVECREWKNIIHESKCHGDAFL